MGNNAWGYVYVISNKGMPGLNKVGYTTRLPSERAKELSASSGAPYPYKVIFQIETINPYLVEQYAQNILKNRKAGKEWFRCSREECVHAIEQAVEINGGKVREIENQRQQDAMRQAERIINNEEFERLSLAYNKELDLYIATYTKEAEKASEIYPESKLFNKACSGLGGSILFLTFHYFLLFNLPPKSHDTMLTCMIIFCLVWWVCRKISKDDEQRRMQKISEYLSGVDELKQRKNNLERAQATFLKKYSDICGPMVCDGYRRIQKKYYVSKFNL